MTSRRSTVRLHSTAAAEQAEPQEAGQVASRIKRRWQDGERPDLSSALADHPELRRYRSVVLDLALEEYRLRVRAGEPVTPSGFAERFPSLQRSLFLLIEVNSLLEQDDEFQSLNRETVWPEPGSRFLGFDLLSEIGRGTFGRVFLAREPALGERLVVLKVALRAGEEADILGRLRHRNIVPVYSVHEDRESGLTAFCMPYLGRATLCDVLDQAFSAGAPPAAARSVLEAVEAVNGDTELAEAPPDRILRRGSYVDGVIHLGAQLAEALAYSHGRGVYHRDLKPSNVLLSAEGRPLVLDFNLSVDDRLPAWRVGGTVPYMAPEELAFLCGDAPSGPRRRYDPRSDLFSLGVILYELLGGRVPFDGIAWDRPLADTSAALRQSQEKGPPSLRSRNPQVDPPLARLIERCLAFTPEERPETAAELAAELQGQLRPLRRGRRWARNHRKLLRGAAAAVLALAVAISAFFALRPPYAERQLQRGLAYATAGKPEWAIEYFNEALRADPAQVAALVARARADQQLGDFRLAFADYDAAYKVAPSPVIMACQGYCLSRLHQDRAAVAAYEAAQKAGFDSVALWNNIGFSYRQVGRISEAETALRHALTLDDRLLPARHNLLLILLKHASEGQPVSHEDLAWARGSLEIAPPSADLCRDVARLYALAANKDPANLQAALQYATMAIDRGIDPKGFVASPTLATLLKEQAFSPTLAKSPGEVSAPKAVHVLDPLDGSEM